MKNLKKIIAFLTIVSIVAVMFIVPVGASSYVDVADGLYYTNAVEALSSYGIISGYNGSFRPGAKVTRAELAKMASLISGLDDQIYSNAGYKKFFDVDLYHWATGYINTVSDNRIIVGYPDGSFQPERNVTYAEALTIVLRTLGYTTDILGDNWPYAYIIKAEDLGLSKGLNVSTNEYVNRGDLCVIINRALQTKINGSSNKLISKMNITTTDDLLITKNKDDYTPAVVIKNDIYSALASVGISKEEVDKSTVIKNGNDASIADAEIYDVVYYLEDSSVIYLYSDKISGVYNKAFPNKANVTSVEISGTTLEIETQTAAYKLGEKSGKYQIGSRLTALLGMDGKIVDVVDLSSADKSNFGVLLSNSVENSTEINEVGKQYNYFTFLNGEGNILKYKTNKDYDDKVGYIGKIMLNEGGYAEFNALSSKKLITGTVDKKNRKIGDHWLTSDCVIIELKPTTATTSQLSESARVIKFEDIVPNELTDNHVIHSVTGGDFDDITLLFVKNVSSEHVQYGILNDSSASSGRLTVNGKYEVYSDGQLSSYSTNFYNNIADGSAVAMTFNGNSLISIKKITTVANNKKILASDFSRVKTDSGVYKVADDVQIVQKKSNNYTSMSKSEIGDLKGKNVSLFSDINTKEGGMIRIILVLN